eukprot:CAMPEP_0118866870 /NCGR_PEP_ID=MMETSP1163-20130328/10653_1 /TAXON_ID=124430 /ORGANISM="Phaeomonas parva, Strain CCMP2877" /LENGTH=146 /DNA_ID=CAMNT_0006801229 /DNA_START=157 /DNA_END=593 /DNA_ORIENTATION=-
MAFHEEKHVAYVRSLREKTDTFEHIVTEHLRMSGIYWGVSAMALMGRDLEAEMAASEIADWVMSCAKPDGSFGGSVHHDGHLLYTLSAVQLLALCGALERVDGDAVAAYVAGLQLPDGSFQGDKWGEVDTRFSYCALNCLALLGRL